ncbi:glycogen debranching protein [bacterium]|nr:glycogen debranching protein [bacterium]
MKLRLTAAAILLCAIAFPSCNRKDHPLYKSDAFTVYRDRVEQGAYTARAASPQQMTSDYVSLNANIDPIIQFKFSINGRDNELAFGVNHQANIYPVDGQEVILDVTFGQKSDLGSDTGPAQYLPPNTKVRFRVDFTAILRSFEENGYYEDILGNRIFEADFKGLYVAGDTYPLNWDFENISGNPQLKLEDPDGDGIFENELIFNVFDPSAHTSSEWKLTNDISGYPQFESSSLLLNAIHNMSLDEMVMLMEEDGTFRTGKEWAGVWTRDVSYATLLSLAYLDPERCMNSLMRKVSGNRIIQDTGTGGAWPVSSDRVVWALAAWEVYKYTGDMEWLGKSFEIIKNSVEDDRNTIVDPATGLIRGESSFLDWRKQTYPLWMEPADISSSLNLGTNAAYFQALRVLGLMAGELGREDNWSAGTEKLRENINIHMWQEERGYYGQYLYGRYYRSLSPRAEALGEAFTVLFDIAGDERKRKVLQNTPVTPFGITCIYPQIPGIPPYHNNGIWPFVQAFWTMACAGEKQTEAVGAGLASIIRPAALFLTNKENFVAENGDFAGTEINSDRQLWSVAGMLAMYHRILIGISFTADRMEFDPVIPETFSGDYSLTDFRYRGGTYTIITRGWGDGISSFKMDGTETHDHFIPATMTGNHTVEIVMNGKSDEEIVRTVASYTAPETPILSVDNDLLTWTAVNNAAKYNVVINGEKAATTAETSMQINGSDAPAEYQVMAVDSNGVESFLSNPVIVVPATATIRLEAEDFNLRGEGTAGGFSGKGYVRFTLEDNKELVIRVNADAGIYALRMRYANGTGPVNTDNNCGIRSLYVNGSFAGSMVFPQRGKDEWSDWGSTGVEWISLREGENTLNLRYEEFNRNMDGVINEFLLDYIIIEKIIPD